MNKRFLIFSILYTACTIYLINGSQSAAHGGETIVILLPLFWVVAGIIFIVVYRADKFKKRNKLNTLLLIFCTPLPALFFIGGFYIWITHFEFQATQNVYTRNGYIVKEVHYSYQKKTEYWSNFESPNNYYLMDSVVRYDTKEKKYLTEIYKGWERMKGDTETARLPTILK